MTWSTGSGALLLMMMLLQTVAAATAHAPNTLPCRYAEVLSA
jgi:hypothetical protein